MLAHPPKSGKRSDWLNNITSLFGYDQNIPLQSCFVEVALKTAADDLNPFTPSLFTSFDVAKAALKFGEAVKYNQALSHAASRGVIYPFKSSIFRGLLNSSKALGAAADVLDPASVDVALLHGLITEIEAINAGECQ